MLLLLLLLLFVLLLLIFDLMLDLCHFVFGCHSSHHLTLHLLDPTDCRQR